MDVDSTNREDAGAGGFDNLFFLIVIFPNFYILKLLQLRELSPGHKDLSRKIKRKALYFELDYASSRWTSANKIFGEVYAWIRNSSRSK